MQIDTLSAGLGGAVRRWREARRMRAELAAMDRATRGELGLGSDVMVAALARNAGRSPGRLERALDRLGLDGHPSLTDRGYRRDLERTCALCPADRACLRWLRSADREAYGAFCPNAAEFSAMAAGMAAGRRLIEKRTS